MTPDPTGCDESDATCAHMRKSNTIRLVSASDAHHAGLTRCERRLKACSRHTNWTEIQFTNSSVNGHIGIHVLRTNRALTVLLGKVTVAHTQLPSVGFRSWSQFLAVSLQVT